MNMVDKKWLAAGTAAAVLSVVVVAVFFILCVVTDHRKEENGSETLSGWEFYSKAEDGQTDAEDYNILVSAGKAEKRRDNRQYDGCQVRCSHHRFQTGGLYHLSDSGSLVNPALDLNLVTGFVTEHEEILNQVFGLALILLDKRVGLLCYAGINLLGSLKLVNCGIECATVKGVVIRPLVLDGVELSSSSSIDWL